MLPAAFSVCTPKVNVSPSGRVPVDRWGAELSAGDVNEEVRDRGSLRAESRVDRREPPDLPPQEDALHGDAGAPERSDGEVNASVRERVIGNAEEVGLRRVVEPCL